MTGDIIHSQGSVPPEEVDFGYEIEIHDGPTHLKEAGALVSIALLATTTAYHQSRSAVDSHVSLPAPAYALPFTDAERGIEEPFSPESVQRVASRPPNRPALTTTHPLGLEKLLPVEPYNWLPEQVLRWKPLVDAAEEEAGMPDEYRGITLAMLANESQGKPEEKSGLGAVGLMQMMPKTDAALHKKYEDQNLRTGKLTDPEYNVYIAQVLLAEIIERVEALAPDASAEHKIRLIIAEYHSGPAAAREVHAGNRIGPNGETHMRRVLAVFEDQHKRTSTSFDWPFEEQ